jgi:hypothetical protein
MKVQCINYGYSLVKFMKHPRIGDGPLLVNELELEHKIFKKLENAKRYCELSTRLRIIKLKNSLKNFEINEK